jgi:hypothetical protein
MTLLLHDKEKRLMLSTLLLDETGLDLQDSLKNVIVYAFVFPFIK